MAFGQSAAPFLSDRDGTRNLNSVDPRWPIELDVLRRGSGHQNEAVRSAIPVLFTSSETSSGAFERSTTGKGNSEGQFVYLKWTAGVPSARLTRSEKYRAGDLPSAFLNIVMNALTES